MISSLNIRVLLCLVLVGFSALIGTSAKAQDEAEIDGRFAQYMTGAYPAPHSKYCILIDAQGGKVLYSLNPHVHRAPASTTKMMAAIVLLEHGKLTDTVTAPAGIDKVQESSLHLAPNEQLSLQDLLYGMLLRSANDTPVAGAYYLCGSVPKFVNIMNSEAIEEIGCRDTHFVTPNGLYAPGHYSSAYDLALIARYGTQHFPEFNEIVKTPMEKITRSVHTGDEYVKNTAWTFLKVFPGADGIKTGYVSQAGHCFVGSATRNGWRLIAVALDSPSCRSDVMQMLSYGFDNFQQKLVAIKGTPEGSLDIDGISASVPVATADDLSDVISAKNPAQGVVYTERVTPKFRALHRDISVGDVVGTVTLLANGKPVANTDAIATSSVSKSNTLLATIVGTGTAVHAGTIVLRALGLIMLTIVIVLVGLSLHGRSIAKILASAGLGSRRACEQWIRDGRVSVDGVVVSELGAQADPSVNRIAVDGRLIPPPPKRRQYIVLNKPRGYACTLADPHAAHIITELVDLPGKPMLRPVGRLDIETEGLIFLTDDGDFVNKLTHPRYHIAKAYLATVRGRPDEEALTRLGTGVRLEDGVTAPADSVRFVRYFPATDTTDVELVIHEGRNRQVRRMFAAVGHTVMRLVRTRIGAVTLRSMPPGTWRHLTPSEIERLVGSAVSPPPRLTGERPRIVKAAVKETAPDREPGPARPRRGGDASVDKRTTPMPQSQINARRYGKNTRRNIENGQSFRKNRDQ